MIISDFKSEISDEFNRILSWWRTHAIDHNGGFYGEINQGNQVIPDADKGGVLNARILWTFSAAYPITQNPEDLKIAYRAYEYIRDHFIDPEYGGSYWAVAADGRVSQNRKQIYAIAFTIYGLSEYYKITNDGHALQLAIDLYDAIEKYSFDKTNNGYFEAFTRDWKLLEDLRLSEKDRNDPKTMNTHLHIIEAYANLYTVWKDPKLKHSIQNLLVLFAKHIIDSNGNLILFFDKDWNRTSKAVSYGHNIEASWLLQECAEVLDDPDAIHYWKEKAVTLAESTLYGMQSDGSLIHEYDPEHHHTQTNREWWVSAEGMVGYLNAYQITGDKRYFKYSFYLWQFIKQHLLDIDRGEWYWGVHEDYSLRKDYKMGFWKCPYHNTRACIEVIKRL